MKLQAQKRDILGKKVKYLRREGVSPVTLYGPNVEAQTLQVNEKSFLAVFNKAGYNKFIDLEVEGAAKPFKVLVKDLNVHPVKDHVVDISFYAVDEDRKITVEVPVGLIGESPAVKQKLGFIVHQYESIAVHCLPKDLPDNFEVDIKALVTTADTILVSDIELPEGVELGSNVDPSSAIAYIATDQKEIVEDTPAEEEGEEAATEDKKSEE